MNISSSPETEKARNQWIRCTPVMTNNKKYAKLDQALIIKDDPQRLKKVATANRKRCTLF